MLKRKNRQFTAGIESKEPFDPTKDVYDGEGRKRALLQFVCYFGSKVKDPTMTVRKALEYNETKIHPPVAEDDDRDRTIANGLRYIFGEP